MKQMKTHWYAAARRTLGAVVLAIGMAGAPSAAKATVPTIDFAQIGQMIENIATVARQVTMIAAMVMQLGNLQDLIGEVDAVAAFKDSLKPSQNAVRSKMRDMIRNSYVVKELPGGDDSIILWDDGTTPEDPGGATYTEAGEEAVRAWSVPVTWMQTGLKPPEDALDLGRGIDGMILGAPVELRKMRLETMATAEGDDDHRIGAGAIERDMPFPSYEAARKFALERYFVKSEEMLLDRSAAEIRLESLETKAERENALRAASLDAWAISAMGQNALVVNEVARFQIEEELGRAKSLREDLTVMVHAILEGARVQSSANTLAAMQLEIDALQGLMGSPVAVGERTWKLLGGDAWDGTRNTEKEARGGQSANSGTMHYAGLQTQDARHAGIARTLPWRPGDRTRSGPVPTAIGTREAATAGYAPRPTTGPLIEAALQ